ncbi:hypothetical protein DFQ27_009500, partial [Actinomortierella ambigua]
PRRRTTSPIGPGTASATSVQRRQSRRVPVPRKLDPQDWQLPSQRRHFNHHPQLRNPKQQLPPSSSSVLEDRQKAKQHTIEHFHFLPYSVMPMVERRSRQVLAMSLRDAFQRSVANMERVTVESMEDAIRRLHSRPRSISAEPRPEHVSKIPEASTTTTLATSIITTVRDHRMEEEEHRHRVWSAQNNSIPQEEMQVKSTESIQLPILVDSLTPISMEPTSSPAPGTSEGKHWGRRNGARPVYSTTSGRTNSHEPSAADDTLQHAALCVDENACNPPWISWEKVVGILQHHEAQQRAMLHGMAEMRKTVMVMQDQLDHMTSVHETLMKNLDKNRALPSNASSYRRRM